MQGPRFAMLVHLAMALSTVHGWGLPSHDKTSSLSSNESAITGGADGAHDQRQLLSDAAAAALDAWLTPCDGSCDESCNGFFGGHPCFSSCDLLTCTSAEGGDYCGEDCDGFFGGLCDSKCNHNCPDRHCRS